MPTQIETGTLSGTPFRIGAWLVEPSLNRVSRDDTTIQLELKVMDVLVCLAERQGEVVPRQEIVDRVWATEYISDNTLTHAVTELRQALGDDARNPDFIETIHRRGYRLIAAVEPVEPTIGSIHSFPIRAGRPEEDRSPYPGLAAFTEADAEFFFGREAEVSQLWRKVISRRLLAVIGPSGVGKSSLLRAGLIPAAPEGWGTLICQPGEAPFAALAGALAPEFRNEPESFAKFADISNPDTAFGLLTRWRERHAQGLLIVDQFEELFTQTPPEVHSRCADLLGRLSREADVHVLLSMRDDFHFRCHQHASLSPVFDTITPVSTPARAALRRALTEPAAQFGFSFQDPALVEEMLDAVEGERGGLPLLAFTVARLWDARDTEVHFFTRRAYEAMGGIQGALAQHAEATLASIGAPKMPVVREIFRNLVTAEGTRAVREWDELLSVFCDSSDESPAAVLRALIDARLLTSYEIHEDEQEPTRRVEIIHESLLANWPRLVRWRTQDADAAQLRDQLRQAARTWEGHDRARDYLWTGKAFREFAVWRENYPGGLTGLEEEFASSMTAHAKRRKRWRRLAVAGAFAALLGVLGIVGESRNQARAETRRAEAANLLSLAQLEIDSYPSAAVAYATESLEFSDSPAARRLALEALWKGPTAFVVDEGYSNLIGFTADGNYLVQETGLPPASIHVFATDGTDHRLDDLYGSFFGLLMDSESGLFSTFAWGRYHGPWALWSAPEKRLLAKARHELPEDKNIALLAFDARRERMLLTVLEDDRLSVNALSFSGSSQRLGELPFDVRSEAWCKNAPNGEWFAVASGQGAYQIDIRDHGLSEPRWLEQTRCLPVAVACDPVGRFVAVGCENGLIRLLYRDDELRPKEIQGPSGIALVRITDDGSLLEAIKSENGGVETWIWSLENEVPTLLGKMDLGKSRGWGRPDWELNPVDSQIVSILNPDGKIRLWQMQVPADAEPVFMGRNDLRTPRSLAFRPQGQWVATSGDFGLMLWPVARPYPIVIKRYGERVADLVFGPGGQWLATSTTDTSGTVRIWQLEGKFLPPARVVYEAQTSAYDIAASTDGEHILLGNHSETVKLLSLNGEAPVHLPGFVNPSLYVAISPDGRFAAACGPPDEDSISHVIRIWDLASNEEVKAFYPGDDVALPFIHFTEDGRLLSGNRAGLLRWDLQTGESETLFEERVGVFAISSDDARVLLVPWGDQAPYGSLASLDLGTGSTTPLATHGDRVMVVAMDAGGTMAVTGDADGIIRVGPVTGEEPHLLLGSPDGITDIAVDPRGRWIASASGTELRLWPMPDLSKPPLHTLPHDELIAKLKTLTNLLVVRDEESAAGWKLEVGPFPGWAEVPEW